jgi:hypothetical protein
MRMASGVASEPVTPRIDSQMSCPDCGGLLVLGEVAGWVGAALRATAEEEREVRTNM